LAIDLRIYREIDAYADAESEALKLCEAIEPSAPLARQKRMEAISLRESYLRTLELKWAMSAGGLLD
jgi:hypothetical protein